MHKLYELKDKMIAELKKYSDKEMNASTLEAVDKLAHATKNLCKIIDEEGYSERGGSYSMGRGYHDGDMMYAGARGRTGYVRRDSMGRYSSAGNLAEELRDLMKEAPDHDTRMEFEKLISKVERM